MPVPTDFSGAAGQFVVYFARTPSDFLAKDDRWVVRSVQLGSRNRPSTATIQFGRTRYLESGSTIQRPQLFQDSRFVVAWKEPGQNGGTILFDGFGASQPRDETGTVGASQTTESINPMDATETWAQAIDSQIVGAHFAKITGVGMGDIVLDTSMPCVFNPDGLANRSIETVVTTATFSEPDPPPTVHYFTSPGGWDYSEGGSQTRKARYWTFSQAISYVLWYWCGARNSFGVNRNNVILGFGSDLATPNSSDNRIWSTVSPHIINEVPGEAYEGDEGPPAPAPTDFQVTPERLLTAKVPGIDVTGMNALEALKVLCEAAGLGFYTDCKQPFGNIDAPPTPVEHTARVWTPGGQLNSGNAVGEIFLPKLSPYKKDLSGSTALQVAQANTLQAASIHHDYIGLVNTPIIRRQPSMYEVTIYLRPLWRPIHPSLTTSATPTNAYIDNVSSSVSVNPGVTEQKQAIADGSVALSLDIVNAADMSNIDIETIQRPIRFIANALNSKGKYGQQYYDVLRKWGVPTDWRYPDNVYARSSDAPEEFRSYTPISFGDVDGCLENPITSAETGLSSGAESWPQRARPFLPALVNDSSGDSPGIITEISFDSGNRWQEFDSVTVSATDSALWLNFPNPWHVSPSETDVGTSLIPNESNLFIAYVKHKFRVRVTCSIEGSDLATVVQTFPLVTDNICRAQTFLRGPRYSKTAVVSKYKDMTTGDPSALADLNDNTVLDGTNTPWWFFRLTDDGPSMRSEGDRIRAYYGDRKVSGNLTAYYIDLAVSPGMVVPRIEEPAPAASETPREFEFETSTDGGIKLAPHVAGVVYTVGQGQLNTTIVLEDWRSLVGFAGASV